jgi:hypothetical protein
MKHLLQFVTFIIVALLVIPPALAEGLCFTSQAQTVSMDCCNVDQVGTPIAPSAVVQECNEGCCSVAPQNSPAPTIPDKLKVDSTAPDAAHTAPLLALHTPRELISVVICAIIPTQDLPILFHSFRI